MLTLRPKKLLVCVSAQHASGAVWQGGRITHMECFPRSEQGLSDFRQFLAAHPGTPVLVMVNAAEEDYRFETLPHCFGSERKQMVARRLKQHYRNTHYVGACLQGREARKRRDDRYLFSALTDPEIVDEWLRAIDEQELPLAGVYLLPIVSSTLLVRLRVKAPNLLIAARHPDGLRLTYFRDRQFRLSRLMRIDASNDADLARAFTGEISNARLYLHALRSATLDEHLTVLLLDCNDELEAVADAIVHDNPALHCIRAGRAELCMRLGIGHPWLEASTDAVYLQLLGLQPHGDSIAPSAATVRFGRYRTRRAVYAACAGIAAVATLWSASNEWTARGLQMQARELTALIAAQDSRHLQVTRDLRPAPVNGETMKRAVEAAKALRDNARDPVSMMVAVSHALQASPEIVLREFGWTHAHDEIRKGQEPPSASSTAARPAGPAPERKQSAYLAGEIRSFRGDYRAAIASIDALAQRLRQSPHVAEVRAVKMPLNVSPTAVLSGNTLDSSPAASAEFELVIVYRPRV